MAAYQATSDLPVAILPLSPPFGITESMEQRIVKAKNIPEWTPIPTAQLHQIPQYSNYSLFTVI